MFEVRQTQIFQGWMGDLKDIRAVAKIAARIRRAEQGNLGDVKNLGDSVGEMRIDCGPGYRLYFTRQGKILILLLCGGDKSTQDKDIKRAKELAKQI